MKSLILSAAFVTAATAMGASLVPRMPRIPELRRPAAPTVMLQEFVPDTAVTLRPVVSREDDSPSFLLTGDITVFDRDDSPQMKRVYTYDENNLPLLCKVYSYVNGEWESTSDESYEWNDDGYLLSQADTSTGSKVTYTLDDNNRILDHSQYYLNDDGQWKIYLRDTYVYNSAGKVVELIKYSQDNTNPDAGIIAIEKHFGEYDSENRLVKETMHRLGNDYVWTITAETFEYDNDGTQIGHGYQVMKDDKLVNYMHRDYEYCRFGLSKETLYYWNEERGDWSGGCTVKYDDPEFNVEKFYTYNDDGELLMARTTAQREVDGEFYVTREESNTFVPQQDGTIEKTYLLCTFSKGEKRETKRIVYYIHPWGGIWKSFSYTGVPGNLSLSQESLYEYTDDHKTKDLRMWNFSRNGSLGLSYRYCYEYDDVCGETTLLHIMQTDMSDIDRENWVNSARTVVSYDHGAVKTHSSESWNGTDWVVKEATEFEHDYDVSGTKVRCWTTKYPFRPLVIRHYVDGEWMRTTNEYKNLESGLETFRDYRNNDTVEIYNISGLYVGSGFSVDDLPAGIYIVRKGVNAEKVMIRN